MRRIRGMSPSLSSWRWGIRGRSSSRGGSGGVGDGAPGCAASPCSQRSFFVAGLAAAWAFREEPQDRSATAPSPPATSSPTSPAAPTETAPTETEPGREPPVDETVTIAAVGDIAMGRDGYQPPAGGAALFAQVSSLLRGDVVLGNLEQALTESGTSKCGKKEKDCFAFRTPPSTADALADAGLTVLNVANNHSYDYGQAGLDDTVAALESAGLGHTGLVDELPRVQKRPVRVIVLGFGFYPTGESILDIPRAQELVQEADRWADVVVVTFHGGAEGRDATRVPRGMETYLGEERGDLRAFSHAVVDAGADLVVGHGPHVLRGMEWYGDRLIAYSLGNFVGNHTFRVDGPGGVGGVLRVKLRGTARGSGASSPRSRSSATAPRCPIQPRPRTAWCASSHARTSARERSRCRSPASSRLPRAAGLRPRSRSTRSPRCSRS
jgi:Bacterial capsule synthesis protein PGA_cap